MKFICPYCSENSFIRNIFPPEDLEYFYKGPINNKCSYYSCTSCKALLLLPSPSEKELLDAYPADYQVYTSNKPSHKKILGRLIVFLNKFRLQGISKYIDKNSKILDYGCGNASLIYLLNRNGYKNSYGYEPTLIKERDDTIFNSKIISTKEDLIKTSLNIQKFDLLIMNHLIEHIVEPTYLLREITQCLLKKNGLIIGETPLANHFSLRFFGKYAGTLHYPYHVSLCTPKSIKLLLKKKFNNKVNVQFEPLLQPTGWSMTFENLLKRYFYKKIRGRTPLYFFCLILSIPFMISEYLLSKITGRIFTSIFQFKISLY